MNNDAWSIWKLATAIKQVALTKITAWAVKSKLLMALPMIWPTFEDESVETVEIGAKIDLADGRGRLNIAAYMSTYEDVQVSTFDGNAGFVVGNAAESEVQGIEDRCAVPLDRRNHSQRCLCLSGCHLQVIPRRWL